MIRSFVTGSAATRIRSGRRRGRRGGDRPRAVERALELQPDVVVMDLHLPRANGIEATRRIVESSPHVGVLVLTIFADDSGWPLR